MSAYVALPLHRANGMGHPPAIIVLREWLLKAQLHNSGIKQLAKATCPVVSSRQPSCPVLHIPTYKLGLTSCDGAAPAAKLRLTRVAPWSTCMSKTRCKSPFAAKGDVGWDTLPMAYLLTFPFALALAGVDLPRGPLPFGLPFCHCLCP